jgi:uncharacterized membrane protein
MRDTSNQVVLGTFVATFLYCLLVLRSVRRADEGGFVPHIAVTLGVAFALVSVGVLIYFIHHLSVSIQADQVAARIGSELNAAIEHLFPDPIGDDIRESSEERLSDLSQLIEGAPERVTSRHDGYLQYIDAERLLKAAAEADWLVRLECRPGEYRPAGGALVSVWAPAKLDEDAEKLLRSMFVFGRQRTHTQNAEYLVDQLVEIAVRALSPGINDPFTAMTCVDRLGSALCRVTQRKIPSPHRRDDRGTLRIIAEPTTFANLADAALNPIRQHARSSAAVTIRLLETITEIAGQARRPDDRADLRRHAEMLARGAREGLPEREDQEAVEQRYRAAVARL